MCVYSKSIQAQCKNAHPLGNGVNSLKTVLQIYLQYSLLIKSHPLRQTMRSKLFS